MLAAGGTAALAAHSGFEGSQVRGMKVRTYIEYVGTASRQQLTQHKGQQGIGHPSFTLSFIHELMP